MANELQPVVKKRLIYAEDLFEPVDVTVFVCGRSGGKTMAMYEQLFRKRVEMAPTIDAELVVHGRWDDECRCTVCGWYGEDWYKRDAYHFDYCPNCGAKMDGERK